MDRRRFLAWTGALAGTAGLLPSADGLVLSGEVWVAFDHVARLVQAFT